MWKAIPKTLDSNTTQYKLRQNDKILTFQEVISLLKNSTDFIHFFTETLKTSPYQGFFWEVKPVTIKGIHQDFEFVLVNSSTLPTITADPAAFETYFNTQKEVVTFPNMGGDAQLIVPTPVATTASYSHLANFVRNAPASQIETFWKTVAVEYEKLIGEKPKWLSTAGLGVYWLHVRVDSRAKYYRYGGYK